jgi:glycosyltransferase involved in cell wall biosynthesis
MNLSILIPLLNEEESLKNCILGFLKVMQSNNYSYEIIFLDDGTDNSWSIIEQFAAENPNVKGIRFMKNFGKSQALHAGFAKAQGEVIITMDADLQDSPEEIPGLYNMITSKL